MGDCRQTMGEGFWTGARRHQLSRLEEKEFEAIIKEELPIQEGPDIDFSKAPAAIRFKDSYQGDTPSRPGIKMSPLELARNPPGPLAQRLHPTVVLSVWGAHPDGSKTRATRQVAHGGRLPRPISADPSGQADARTRGAPRADSHDHDNV
eukprot:3036760-Pyramimonas_sp.AAC.2